MVFFGLCMSFCVDMIPELSCHCLTISGKLLEKCPFHTASHACWLTALTRVRTSIIIKTLTEMRPLFSKVLTSNSLLADGLVLVSEVAVHWFCAVPLGGLCVSDTASIIFHGVNIKHSREGLSIFMKGRRDQRKRDGGGLQEYLPGV